MMATTGACPRARPIVILWLWVLLACLSAQPFAGARADQPPSADRVAEPQAIDAAIAAVRPALVKIDVVEVDYSEGRERKWEASGSGVIITPEGHVVTNHHVAGNAKRIMCTLASRERIEAELVGSDPVSDIAVIKLTPPSPTVFAVARWGDSAALKVGDRVLAMGSPLAFSQAVTLGIVSNRQLVMPREGGGYQIMMEGEDVGSVVTWIAHDADIYSGNSGGPLVNLEGEVVGINELKMGLGGAIPSTIAREVAAALIEHGEVTRAFLGLMVQPRLEGQAGQQGVLVAGAVPGSPADRAGFRPGDLLVRLAGQEVDVRFREELVQFNRLVYGLRPGSQVEAVVLRQGEPVALTVATEKKEPARPKENEFREWGMCGRDLTALEVTEMGLERREGVLVTAVRSGGPCLDARPALAARDVIVSVGGEAVGTRRELEAVTARLTAAGKEPTPTLVGFVRGKSRYLTVVKVGIKEPPEPARDVRKSWLPAATQVLTRDIALALGAPGQTGVLVTRVYPASSAEAAGLRTGDLIIALNDEPIPAREEQDVEVLPAMVRRLPIGATAALTVLRRGERLTLAVRLEASPPAAREMKRYRDENFEFTARDATFFDQADQPWARPERGALVQEVGQGGWAALGNLGAGDLIVAVNGAAVEDVDALERLMTEIAQRRPDTVVLQVVRGIRRRFVEMRPAWDDSEPARGR